MNEWIKYFPYEKPRQQQTNAIEKVLSEFKNGKKYAVIDCGTGVGKSAIGLTIANKINNSSEFDGNFENGSYFLTTQKILQDQYEKDFGTVISLKSSSNYTCDYHKSNTCSQSQQLLRTAEKGTKFFNKCAFNCKYKKTKKRFLESQESITNFPYFLTDLFDFLYLRI